ncbi:MAG: hypothetical protein PHP75_08510, partial [Methylacidiphilaceae bacterium]|nr:hypothetical protein [Candidatus Methylacidiphilaceae bacterium]
PLLGSKAVSMMMLLFLFAYNASRGASLCGFLPWMTSLVPDGSRGWFLARDLFFSAAASVIILAGSFLLFRGHSSLSAFSWTFWGSFTAGLCSLWLLKQVPDVPIAAADQPRETSARKSEGDRRLFDLMGFNVLMASSLSAGAVFWVPLLQREHQWTPAGVLGLLASQSGLVLLSLVFLRNQIDRFGNRPALLAAILAITTNFGLWLAIAARLLPVHPITLTLVVASWGIGFSCFQVGNVHLAMQLAPREGRSEYFARFSVVNSLALGAGPILWGAFLGSFSGWKLRIGFAEANPYVFLFLCLCLLVAASFFFLARLPGGGLPEGSPAP